MRIFALCLMFLSAVGCTIKSLEINLPSAELSSSEIISGETITLQVSGKFPPYTFTTSLGSITDDGVFTAPTVSETTEVTLTVTDAGGRSVSKNLTIFGFSTVSIPTRNLGTNGNVQMHRVVQSPNGTLWAVGRYGNENSGTYQAGLTNVGAVFKSTDSGSSWTTVDIVYNQYPTAIAVNPDNPAHLVYSYQKPYHSFSLPTGSTFLRQSRDGGVTWSLLDSLTSPSAISGYGSFDSVVVKDLIIYNSRLFACGWVNKVGSTFALLPFLIKSSTSFEFTEIQPLLTETTSNKTYLDSFYADGNDLWAFGGRIDPSSFSGSLLMKSSNTGDTWQKLTGDEFNSEYATRIYGLHRTGINSILKVSQDYTGIYDNSGTHVTYSSIGNDHPLTLRHQIYQDSSKLIIGSQNIDGYDVYNYLSVSEDNGLNFTRQLIKSNVPGNTAFSGILSIRNRYFAQLSGPLLIGKTLAGLYFYLTQECRTGIYIYYNCKSSKIVRFTSLDAVTWTRDPDLAITTGGFAKLKSVSKSPNGDLYALLQSFSFYQETALVQKSTDSGLTWQVIDSFLAPPRDSGDPEGGSWESNNIYKIHAFDDRVLISVGSEIRFDSTANVLKSYDPSTNIISDLPKLANSLRLLGANSTGQTYFVTSGYVGNGDGHDSIFDFYVSNNDGATSLSSAGPFGRNIIGYPLGSAGIVFQMRAALNIYDGSTLTNVALPDSNYSLKAVDQNSNFYFYDSGSNTLKKSRDALSTWQTISLPTEATNSLKLFFNPELEYLYISDVVDGRSVVWRSKDSGVTWFKNEAFDDGTSSAQMTELVVTDLGYLLALGQAYDSVSKSFGFFVRRFLQN